jgi:hypothetical protein
MQDEEVLSASSFELQNGICQADFGFDTADSLHLNRTGYKLWVDVLRPMLIGVN